MGPLKVLTIFSVLLLQSAAAWKCYDCAGIDDIDKCTNSVECKPNEHCHARKYIDGSLNFLFDVNCKPLSLCSRLEQNIHHEQRDGFEVLLWTSCCGDDYCNVNFDNQGEVIDPSQRVMECYSCQGLDDPADCNQTITCKPGEVCITHEKINRVGKVFDLGCLPRGICAGIGVHLELARKRHVKRFELCRGCCDRRSLCNNQFCSKKLGLTDMTAVGATPSVKHTTTATTTIPTSPPPSTTVDPLTNFHLQMTPYNQTGTIGSTIVFDCEFDHFINESMTLTWYFKDKNGVVKKIYTRDVRPPALDFYVKYLDVTDEGEYICEAKFNGHTWTSTGILTVPGYLEITKGPDTVSVKRGDPATFTCDVDGQPKPTVTWELLHNSPFPQNVSQGVSVTPTGSMLVIGIVADSDTGVYKCIATSSIGSKSSLAVLSIT